MLFPWALLVAPLLLAGGCATSALWEEGRFARFREPASPSALRCFRSREADDFLVCYEEGCDDNSKVRRPRAYWLVANHEPIENPHKPRFVSVNVSDGLQTVPVLATSPTNAPPPEFYIVASTNAQTFTLFAGEKPVGNYDLPVYETGSGRAKQILLTPFAFAADLTIIGGCVFAIAWSEEGLGDIH